MRKSPISKQKRMKATARRRFIFHKEARSQKSEARMKAIYILVSVFRLLASCY
jgi:hypothetical protein